MADYFADAYFGSKYWTADYFQGGEVDPNAMQAALSGSATITANLTAETVTEAATYTGGPFSFPKRQSYRLDDEEQADDLRKEIVRIGEASKAEVITGIVQRPRKARPPNIETLARVAQQRRQAEQARQEQIRRQIAADDEWLMMA